MVHQSETDQPSAHVIPEEPQVRKLKKKNVINFKTGDKISGSSAEVKPSLMDVDLVYLRTLRRKSVDQQNFKLPDDDYFLDIGRCHDKIHSLQKEIILQQSTITQLNAELDCLVPTNYGTLFTSLKERLAYQRNEIAGLNAELAVSREELSLRADKRLLEKVQFIGGQDTWNDSLPSLCFSGVLPEAAMSSLSRFGSCQMSSITTSTMRNTQFGEHEQQALQYRRKIAELTRTVKVLTRNSTAL
jgi:hypothetical protein